MFSNIKCLETQIHDLRYPVPGYMTASGDFGLIVTAPLADAVFAIHRDRHVASDARQATFWALRNNWRWAFDHYDLLANTLLAKGAADLVFVVIAWASANSLMLVQRNV